MPYTGPDDADLPSNVKAMGERDRERWVSIWNNTYRHCSDSGGSDCEGKAFRVANGVLKESLGKPLGEPLGEPLEGAKETRVEPVTESLATLRAALAALRAAYDDLPDLEDDDEWDSAKYRLKNAISCVKQVIRDQWVDQNALGAMEALAEQGEWASEVGAKFSAASKAAILDAVNALKTLVGVEAPDQTTKDELAEVIGEAVGSLESCEAEYDKKRKKMHKTQESGKPSAYTYGSWIIEQGSNPQNNQYRMLVIREGLSGNRVNYSGKALKEAAPLLNGRPIYMDHPSDPSMSRSMTAKVGWWSDAEFVEGLAVGEQSVNGIVATANILSNSPHPWLGGMIRESLERGQPDVVGVSIVAYGDFENKRGESGIFKETLKLHRFASADIVAEPGAGGRPLSIREGIGNVDEEIMELENLTVEQLRELRPDLVEALLPAKNDNPPATPPAPEPPSGESTAVLEAVNDGIKFIQLERQRLTVENKLKTANLPTAVCEEIRADIGDKLMQESEIDALIARYVKIATTVAEDAAKHSSGGLPGSMLIPYGKLVTESGMISPLDQVMAQLDDWFGNDVSESLKGHFHRIDSMKQWYKAVTGDMSGGVDGVYNAKESVIGPWLGMPVMEALPTQATIVGGSTITLPALFGTSMNRRLTKAYQGQSQWWRPVVDVRPLNNFKQQDRIRLHNFGSLTNRPVGTEEYTELAWAETQESYTPTGYGNLVPINRRAFINDDLEGLRRIPMLLGQSAAFTINEYVANLFTQNSGNGPTLTDGIQVFNAAGHQGNRLTSALNYANLISAIKVGFKFNNDASKRTGFRMRHLLVPIDLADTGWRLLTASGEPGSANNDRNFMSSEWGVNSLIVPPQFTDTDNWYLMPDPSEVVNIEMGFINGQEEPSLYLQQNETIGLVFTHDVINFKIRHEYGGDWIDYKAVASIV